MYSRRPYDCRLFFALGNPENCQMPQREHQLFAQLSPRQHTHLLSLFFIERRRFVSDHLGVLLAEKLLHVNVRSGSRHVMEHDLEPGDLPDLLEFLDSQHIDSFSLEENALQLNPPEPIPG